MCTEKKKYIQEREKRKREEIEKRDREREVERKRERDKRERVHTLLLRLGRLIGIVFKQERVINRPDISYI